MGVPIAHRRPHVPDSVLHMLQRVLKRAGLPRIRFHDLRHTFATMALQNGVDVKTVSAMLGHYSAGFTLDTYAHVTTDAQLKAAQTMGISSPVLSDSTGHGPPQRAVLLHQLDELQTGVVGTLVAADDGSSLLSEIPWRFTKQLDRFQNKIHFQRFAHRIGQDLLCAGVQDRGEVEQNLPQSGMYVMSVRRMALGR